jgi:asparagine synthase (glutamine-hydrolysing)
VAAGGVAPEIDDAAVAEYLSLGYVGAPRSLFRGVRKLPPAHRLSCTRGQIDIGRYWRPGASIDEGMDDAQCVREVRDTLERAVVSQMVSDVPLGAFLSGGIDSSAIVAMMARHSSRPVKTYAIGFQGVSGAAYYNELPWARQVAARFGTEHHEIVVQPDVARLLPRLLWHMDEPVADAAFITTHLVAEFARRDVTVILSGVGGDELFGGYRRYLASHYDGYYDLVPRWLRRGLVEPLARAIPIDRHSALLNAARHLRKYALSHSWPVDERYRSYVHVLDRAAAAGLLRAGSPPRRDALDAAFAEIDVRDPLARVSRVDVLSQLPDDLLMLTDRTTMASSLECRVPFLDNEVLDLSLRLPSRFKVRRGALKHGLKRALADVLPREILERKKRGFGAPIGAWFKHELGWLVERVLSRSAVHDRGLLDWPAVERTIALHRTQREDNTDLLLALMNLELWCRLYLDGRSHEDVAAELVEPAVATGGRR